MFLLPSWQQPERGGGAGLPLIFFVVKSQFWKRKKERKKEEQGQGVKTVLKIYIWLWRWKRGIKTVSRI